PPARSKDLFSGGMALSFVVEGAWIIPCLGSLVMTAHHSLPSLVPGAWRTTRSSPLAWNHWAGSRDTTPSSGSTGRGAPLAPAHGPSYARRYRNTRPV